jgi:uncharacterized membrane protein/glutaredoxin
MSRKRNQKKTDLPPAPDLGSNAEIKCPDWWSVLPWIARLLQVGAVGLSTYLLYHALTSEAISGCGTGAACDRVLTSPYAWWLGLPVSALAVAIYCGLILVSTGLSKKWTNPPRPWVGHLILAGSIMVVGSVIWFVGIQWLELKAFCRLCCTTHAMGTVSVLLLALSWKHVQTIAQNNLPIHPPSRGWRRTAWPVALGLAGVGLLIAGQLLFPKRMTLVHFHDGKFNFDLSKVPVLGKPGTNVVIDLFDYTCPHCRELHHLLQQALVRYSNQFCIIALPAPMNTNCNAVVSRTPPAHVQACDYAQVGMGVFAAEPRLYPEYDTWFFKQPKIPALNEAREQASRLVGSNQLMAAMASPQAAKMIQTGVSLYKANRLKAKATALPQLVLGKVIHAGSIFRAEDLHKLLEAQLQVKPGEAPSKP